MASIPQRTQLKYWQTEGNYAILTQFARSGLNKLQIAEIIGISHHTLDKWASKDIRISSALKNAPQDAVAVVENALFRKAQGYNATVNKAHKVKRIEYGADGKKLREWEDVVTVEETIHVPADTVAEIFFLKNRRPDAWRDKIEQVQSKEDEGETGVVMLPPVSAEEMPPVAEIRPDDIQAEETAAEHAARLASMHAGIDA